MRCLDTGDVHDRHVLIVEVFRSQNVDIQQLPTQQLFTAQTTVGVALPCPLPVSYSYLLPAHSPSSLHCNPEPSWLRR